MVDEAFFTFTVTDGGKAFFFSHILGLQVCCGALKKDWEIRIFSDKDKAFSIVVDENES
jgi:hypothetical protein